MRWDFIVGLKGFVGGAMGGLDRLSPRAGRCHDGRRAWSRSPRISQARSVTCWCSASSFPILLWRNARQRRGNMIAVRAHALCPWGERHPADGARGFCRSFYVGIFAYAGIYALAAIGSGSAAAGRPDLARTRRASWVSAPMVRRWWRAALESTASSRCLQRYRNRVGRRSDRLSSRCACAVTICRSRLWLTGSHSSASLPPGMMSPAARPASTRFRRLRCLAMR